MKRKKTISVVVPCYNEEENIRLMYQRLLLVARKCASYQFEFVFVDNGSLDKTASIITDLTRKDAHVVGIFLSRNFGPEASTIAGLDYASGDAIVMVACDMQDPPELIVEFVRWWEKGFEVVLGSYKNTQDTWIMSIFRKTFYRLFRFVSSIDVPVNNTGFGLMSRRVVRAIRHMPEAYFFFRGIRAWVGFRTKYISYLQRERKHGISSYNIYRYFRFAERSLLALSALPLDIAMNVTAITGLFCFPFALVTAWFVEWGVPGKIVVFVLLCLTGIAFLSISIMGKYLQVIFEEAKRRPVYVVERTIHTNVSAHL